MMPRTSDPPPKNETPEEKLQRKAAEKEQRNQEAHKLVIKAMKTGIDIPLTDIAPPLQRLRAHSDDNVKAIADSFVESGQLQAIVIRPREDGGYWIVAGLHRFEAAKKLHWQKIRCTIVTGLDADHITLAEIDENLIRAGLGPDEESKHLAKRQEIYLRLNPETKQGGAPGKTGGGKVAKVAKVASFVEATAKATGKSKRSVARGVARGKAVKVDVAGTSLDTRAELDALGKLAEDEQRKLADRAKAGEPVSAKTLATSVGVQNGGSGPPARLSDHPEVDLNTRIRSERGDRIFSQIMTMPNAERLELKVRLEKETWWTELETVQ